MSATNEFRLPENFLPCPRSGPDEGHHEGVSRAQSQLISVDPDLFSTARRGLEVDQRLGNVRRHDEGVHVGGHHQVVREDLEKGDNHNI